MATFEVKKSGDGEMFNLKAGNGEVIGTSEVYNSRASLENGIASVKKNAPEAPVEKSNCREFREEDLPEVRGVHRQGWQGSLQAQGS